MVNRDSTRRKPRVRKTTPTVRELAEAQTTRQETPKRRRRTSLWRVIKGPFSWLVHSDSLVPRALRVVLRPVGKVLKRLVPRYFTNSWSELKKVTWPGRKETWRLTAAVFGFAITFGALIYFVDLALDKLFRVTVLR